MRSAASAQALVMLMVLLSSSFNHETPFGSGRAMGIMSVDAWSLLLPQSASFAQHRNIPSCESPSRRVVVGEEGTKGSNLISSFFVSSSSSTKYGWTLRTPSGRKGHRIRLGMVPLDDGEISNDDSFSKSSSTAFNDFDRENDAEVQQQQTEGEDSEPEKTKVEEDPEVVALKQDIASIENALHSQKRELMQARDRVEAYSKEGYARKVAEVETMRRARTGMNASNRNAATANVVAEFAPVWAQLNELNARYSNTEFGRQYEALPGAFSSALKELGVSTYSVQVGDPVDTFRMNVVREDSSERLAKGTVFDVVSSTGLELQGIVIRKAEVVASSGPAITDTDSENENMDNSSASTDAAGESTPGEL